MLEKGAAVPLHMPAILSHLSFCVQALLSLQARPGTNTWDGPDAGSQASSVHTSPSPTGIAAPAHAPEPLHASFVVQALPSLHAAPVRGTCDTMPVDGLHESVVQMLPSSTGTGFPERQAPVESQASPLVHPLPSEQLRPATAECVHSKLCAESLVHGFPSSQL
jgi:hypothetical protein